ncbi:hypothetical protein ACMTN4_07510 [Rhodococcus globerulus]|uniref:hypothetical protein n=1 Tax=Rhodococcus globerulus TaxID=33008 RepID=UPI0039EA72F9
MPLRTMAVVPANTAGTGGALTDVTGVNYSSPTNSYSSKYHLYAAGLDWTKPVGLMVHFHGDGAFEYNNPTSSWMLGGANGMIAQAKARNMLLLVPLTPDDAVGRFTWWAWYGKEENPRYAKDLIAYILGRYKIDKKRIWLSGYSGGSQFITRYLLPHFGVDLGIVGGGFICFGGGQAPAASFEPYNPAFKAAWHCRWVVGALDDGTGSGDGFNAIAASNVGAAWYSGQGFTTEVTQLAGLGHDLDGLYGPHTGAEIDARPVPKTLAQVTAARFNNQTVKEARMMINGVMTQVYPALRTPTIGAMAVTVATTAVTSVACAIPAGNVGDLMLMLVGHEGSVTTPAGWTFLAGMSADNWGRVSAYTRIRTGSDPSAAVTFSQAKRHAVRIISITDGRSAIAEYRSSGGAASSVGVIGITTPSPKNLVIAAVGWRSLASPTFTWPSPWTELAKDTAAAATSSYFTSLGVATRAEPIPVAIADFTVAASSATAGGYGTTSIAISPM